MNNYPEVYLIGAMKSGTTTLASYLSIHKHVFVCPNKEPGYFSRDERFTKGETYYLSLFEGAREGQIKVDASTCYSRWPYYDKAISRIFAAAPDAKFIYIMRDPVYRTYSHYKHMMIESYTNGIDILSFDEAVKTDQEMMCASDYALQISKYLETFQKKQFYFTTLDLLIENPQKVMSEVFNFLNLSPIAQSISASPIHKNTIGDRIKYNLTLKQIDSYINTPIIQKFKFLMPQVLRSKTKTYAHLLFRHFRDSGDYENKLANVSKLTKKNIVSLREHFRGSVVDTEQLTGLDLSSWKNTNSALKLD